MKTNKNNTKSIIAKITERSLHKWSHVNDEPEHWICLGNGTLVSLTEMPDGNIYLSHDDGDGSTLKAEMLFPKNASLDVMVMHVDYFCKTVAQDELKAFDDNCLCC